jgi:urease accessory protein
VEAGLHQLGRAALPFVTAAHAEPERLEEFDRLCDAFTTNHVANRASRAQGKAFLAAVRRVFADISPQGNSTVNGDATVKRPEGRAPYGHFAPVFGACLRGLTVSGDTVGELIFFNHLRGVLAAAVRLNIIGPMEAQAIQHQLAPEAERVLKNCATLTLNDIAQTSPLLDLWQGAQDRLYSRLFQS